MQINSILILLVLLAPGRCRAQVPAGNRAQRPLCKAMMNIYRFRLRDTGSGDGGQMLLYPNPSSGQVTIELPATAVPPLRLEVTNASGIRLRRYTGITDRKITIDLTDLPPGLYPVSLQTAHQTICNRILEKIR